MSFDKNTKTFLVTVLNEQTPFGGVGGSQTLAPKISKKPKFANWVPGEEKAPDYVQGEKQSEDDYYKDLFKTGMAGVGSIDPEKEGANAPSLGYLGGLGVLKRTMGYNTSPGTSSELIDFNLRNKATGSLDPTKIVTNVGSRAVKTGLGAAALSYGMGELGNKLAGKLPYLAALGVDPFDYATKIMGVDYVSDQFSKLPNRQYKQMISGGGYFQP